MKLEEGHIREIWEEFGVDKGTYGQNTSHTCMKLSKINNFLKKESWFHDTYWLYNFDLSVPFYAKK